MLALIAASARAAAAQTVTISGAGVQFYASHLVLDATGRAYLEDGVVHVSERAASWAAS